MKKLTSILVLTLLVFPSIARAQLTGIGQLILRSGFIIDALIVLMAGVALLVFFWGLAKFIFRIGGDEKAVEEGKKVMKWGLIALFVMVSVWGIIKFFQRELLPGGDFTPPGIPLF